MSNSWQQYEGEVINSRYHLGELLHTEENTAIYATLHQAAALARPTP